MGYSPVRSDSKDIMQERNDARVLGVLNPPISWLFSLLLLLLLLADPGGSSTNPAQDAPPNAHALSSRGLLELAERLEALGRPGMAERSLLAARRMVPGGAGGDGGTELAQELVVDEEL
ncbi:hypothetical protein T484DRAFT_1898662 [Baffinella frigidus]|nr:hypothetical protein T484DRAFT_1898662 [Cryptophyta sp. CCMP2293]